MSYGVTTDTLGLIAGDTKSAWKQISSSQSPGTNEAQATDSKGTIAASTIYDTVTQYEFAYVTCSDTAIDLYDTATAVDFRLGKVIGGKVITGADLATSQTDRPVLTIRAETCGENDTAVNKFTPLFGSATGARQAQRLGFIPTANDTVTNIDVTGSTISNSVKVSRTQDSRGITQCMNVSAGRCEGTTNMVAVVGATVGGAADAANGYTLSSGPSTDKGNTEYGTGSATYFQNLAMDT